MIPVSKFHPLFINRFIVTKEDGHDFIHKHLFLKEINVYICENCGAQAVKVPEFGLDLVYVQNDEYTCKEFKLRKLIK